MEASKLDSINKEINGRELIAKVCDDNGLVYDEVLILVLEKKLVKDANSVSVQKIKKQEFLL